MEVGFNIPNITLHPSLDVAQMAIADVANAILESTRSKISLKILKSKMPKKKNSNKKHYWKVIPLCDLVLPIYMSLYLVEQCGYIKTSN